MSCDLCGKAGKRVLAKIEGVAYRVCEDCAKLGERIEEYRPKPKVSFKPSTETVSQNYGSLIRQAREASGKSQKDFAAFLNVKESLIHSWESNHLKPTLEMAKKLQKKLHISLIEDEEPVYQPVKTSTSEGMTIGDVFKKK